MHLQCAVFCLWRLLCLSRVLGSVCRTLAAVYSLEYLIGHSLSQSSVLYSWLSRTRRGDGAKIEWRVVIMGREICITGWSRVSYRLKWPGRLLNNGHSEVNLICVFSHSQKFQLFKDWDQAIRCISGYGLWFCVHMMYNEFPFLSRIFQNVCICQ